MIVGYFGASTGPWRGAGRAAEHPRNVGAVLSRGGRPDLAGPALPQVATPKLLIVGARGGRYCEQVGRLDAVWFTRHLDASALGRWRRRSLARVPSRYDFFFLRLDFVSPCSLRTLFTVRAARSSA